ncbi:MAG: hypothetical protein AAF604_03800 [Acidobacteriota bacterium]
MKQSLSRTRRAGERGITMVEALIAMALLLLVAIGILPLFTRAITNNASGSVSTQIANHARRQLETVYQLPFNNQALTITTGTERQSIDYFSSGNPKLIGDEVWTATQPTGTAYSSWTRTTMVRQYSLGGSPTDADADGVLDLLPGLQDADKDGLLDDPLSAGTDAGFIHLKEVEVLLQSNGSAQALGPTPDLRIRVLKPF